MQNAIDAAVARAFIYRLLAKAFEDPEADVWVVLNDAATHQACELALAALSERREATLRDAAGAWIAKFAAAALETFKAEYVATFGHAARGRCPLNEIEYGDIKADPLFQPHRLADLAAFYRAFGLELAPGASERHDHICLELEFMSVLAAKEAYALEHQLDDEQLALCRDAQKKFLREHLGRWTPGFTRRLERMVGDSALGALAKFTREFVIADCRRFAVVAGSEDLLLRSVDPDAESMCASCGIKNLPPGALRTSV